MILCDFCQKEIKDSCEISVALAIKKIGWSTWQNHESSCKGHACMPCLEILRNSRNEVTQQFKNYLVKCFKEGSLDLKSYKLDANSLPPVDTFLLTPPRRIIRKTLKWGFKGLLIILVLVLWQCLVIYAL